MLLLLGFPQNISISFKKNVFSFVCVNACVTLHIYTYKLICDHGTQVRWEPHSPHVVADFNASDLFQGV